MKRTTKITTGWIAASVMLAMAGSLTAHHSLAQFDLTTAIRVKGTIVRVELVNPHSLIFMDQKISDGKVQRWAVEGPGVIQLSRVGFNKASLKVGDVIEACGYVMKEGFESQRIVSTESAGLILTASTPKSISGRLMDAETVALAGGQSQKWSDYGQHLCLGPDFHDFHK